MKFLGIDPGMKITGYAILEKINGEINLITCGEIQTEQIEQRHLKIFLALEDIIYTYKPDISAVETTYVNINPMMSLRLVEARSVAILCLQKNNIKYYEISPKLIKKGLLGRGDATKIEVIKEIHRLFNVKFTHNLADAIAIALAAKKKDEGKLFTIKEENVIKKKLRLEKKLLKLNLDICPET